VRRLAYAAIYHDRTVRCLIEYSRVPNPGKPSKKFCRRLWIHVVVRTDDTPGRTLYVLAFLLAVNAIIFYRHQGCACACCNAASSVSVEAEEWSVGDLEVRAAVRRRGEVAEGGLNSSGCLALSMAGMLVKIQDGCNFHTNLSTHTREPAIRQAATVTTRKMEIRKAA
jgi:hypothetical protein